MLSLILHLEAYILEIKVVNGTFFFYNLIRHHSCSEKEICFFFPKICAKKFFAFVQDIKLLFITNLLRPLSAIYLSVTLHSFHFAPLSTLSFGFMYFLYLLAYKVPKYTYTMYVLLRFFSLIFVYENLQSCGILLFF